MKNTTRISEVMSPSPVTIGHCDTMDMAEMLFEKHGIHHLPVVENGQLLGVVSHTDLLKITRQIFGDKLENRKNDQIKQSLTPRELMGKSTVSIAPTDTVGDALRLFRENRFHSLPVVMGPGKRLVGIVTTTDLLRVFEESLTKKCENGCCCCQSREPAGELDTPVVL